MQTDALHHLVINLDAQDSGQRTNAGQLLLRAVVHDVVRAAFTAAEINTRGNPEDRGDGVLLVLPADVSKQKIVGRWVDGLYQALKVRNSPLRERIRVRIGIHAGEVHHDNHGVAGTDVNIACRLASCEPARGTLRAAPDASVVVAVSDYIYQSVVRHGGPYIEPDHYQKYPLDTAEYHGSLWLYVPRYSVPPPPTSAPEPTPTPPTPAENTHGGIGSMTFVDSGAVFNQSTFHDPIKIHKSNRDRRYHER